MTLMHGGPEGEIRTSHGSNWHVNKIKNGAWEIVFDPKPLENNMAPKFTPVHEQNRTYTFPNGTVSLEGIVDINVSKSGTHRINTKDGKKHIIPPGWIHIEFDAKDWTF